MPGCTKEELAQIRKERLGEERLNNNGQLMRIVEYNVSDDIVVEFQDEHKLRTHTAYHHFKSGKVRNPYDDVLIKEERLGQEKINNQGCPMKIIEYNSSEDILVEFQDGNKTKVRTTYSSFKKGTTRNDNFDKLKEERLGQEKLNNQGYLMTIIEYNKANDIVVEFQDEHKMRVNTSYGSFKDGSIKNNYPRLGEERNNKHNCLMKIVEYNNSNDIVVEFQDEYKTRVRSSYDSFKSGNVKNPYYPSVFGVGITGNKHCTTIDGKTTKEYMAWKSMLERCFYKTIKTRYKTYENVTCCDEWLLFDNLCEWLYSQSNFDKWLNGKKYSLDKDIIVKGNKIYSPDTCCLVPHRVNVLFVKNDANRGELPIGVERCKNRFRVKCEASLYGNTIKIRKKYKTVEDAFAAYKEYKENVIKQVAQIEFDACNITKKCYDAMMKYEVEITD